MGKKSIEDSQLLPMEEAAAMKAIEVALNPQQIEPMDLYNEIQKIALQTHIDSQEIRHKVPVRIHSYYSRFDIFYPQHFQCCCQNDKWHLYASRE